MTTNRTTKKAITTRSSRVTDFCHRTTPDQEQRRTPSSGFISLDSLLAVLFIKYFDFILSFLLLKATHSIDNGVPFVFTLIMTKFQAIIDTVLCSMGLCGLSGVGRSNHVDGAEYIFFLMGVR